MFMVIFYIIYIESKTGLTQPFYIQFISCFVGRKHRPWRTWTVCKNFQKKENRTRYSSLNIFSLTWISLICILCTNTMVCFHHLPLTFRFYPRRCRIRHWKTVWQWFQSNPHLKVWSFEPELSEYVQAKPLLQKWLKDADTMCANLNTPVGGSPGGNWNSLSPESVARRRKKRTSMETNIRVALEKGFQQNPIPSSEEITSVADQLSIEKEVVRVWFCNRRQKQKRINPPSNYNHQMSSPLLPPYYTCAGGGLTH